MERKKRPTNPSPPVILLVKMRRQLKDGLRRVAKHRGTTMSELVRGEIERLVREEKG